jgi:hypothetical protein
VAKSKDTVKVKVVGPNAVAGVEAPNTVELDPDKVNIPILVETGQVELIDKLPEDASDDATKTVGRKAKS